MIVRIGKKRNGEDNGFNNCCLEGYGWKGNERIVVLFYLQKNHSFNNMNTNNIYGYFWDFEKIINGGIAFLSFPSISSQLWMETKVFKI